LRQQHSDGDEVEPSSNFALREIAKWTDFSPAEVHIFLPHTLLERSCTLNELSLVAVSFDTLSSSWAMEGKWLHIKKAASMKRPFFGPANKPALAADGISAC
jgi:hypothetical protein